MTDQLAELNALLASIPKRDADAHLKAAVAALDPDAVRVEGFKRGIAAMEQAFFRAIVVLRKQSKGFEVTNEPKDPLEYRLADAANRIVESIQP